MVQGRVRGPVQISAAPGRTAWARAERLPRECPAMTLPGKARMSWTQGGSAALRGAFGARFQHCHRCPKLSRAASPDAAEGRKPG